MGIRSRTNIRIRRTNPGSGKVEATGYTVAPVTAPKAFFGKEASLENQKFISKLGYKAILARGKKILADLATRNQDVEDLLNGYELDSYNAKSRAKILSFFDSLLYGQAPVDVSGLQIREMPIGFNNGSSWSLCVRRYGDDGDIEVNFIRYVGSGDGGYVGKLVLHRKLSRMDLNTNTTQTSQSLLLGLLFFVDEYIKNNNFS